MKARFALKGALYLTVSLGMQLHADDPVRFEVASVKAAGQCTFERSLDPQRIALNVPLSPILMMAFGMTKDQIIGPAWLDTDCFEIAAKMPQGSKPEQMAAMLRTLLEDRFKMSARKESRPGTVYALVVDKNGPKVKEAAEDSTFMGKYSRNVRAIGRGGRGALRGIMTMEDLAKALSNQGIGPVVDATGLKGEYEIGLSWVPNQGAPDTASDPAADLFTAVRETLGLRLESRKSPTEVLVIDHIERVPTGN